MNVEKEDLLKRLHISKEIFLTAGSSQKDDLSLVLTKLASYLEK